MRQNHTSHFAWTTVVAGLASWLLALGLVACQSTSDPVESRAVEGEPVENLYGLTPEIVGEVPERTWTEPPVRRIAQLPGRSNQPLYIPVMARIKRDGRIYVWDAGDSAYLKAFTPEGEFVQGYGRGQGQGPGQVGGALMDFGVRGDSIYVVDGRYRRIHVFGKDGGYGRTDVHQRSIHRLDYSRDSTTCISRVGPQSSTLLEMRAPGKRPQAVPYPVDRDIPLMHLVISMDGKAFAHQDRCIYVPKYYPVILTYSHGDTVGRAHPTPTYGEVSMPEARTEENGVVRPPSLPITNSPMLDQGLLSVRFKGEGSGRGADGTIVLTYDVFDAETMAYVHSVRLRVPQRGTKSYAYYAARRGLLTTVQDTTVYIYRVEDGRDGV